MSSKVIVIGIDGGAPWIIRELLKSYDNLRGFRRLSENGLMSTLTSISPPLSGPAWASVYTGVKPQDHGILDFVYVARDYKFRPFGFVNQGPFPPIWDFLHKAGLRTIIINPPMVYPSYKVDGVFVSGWPGPRLCVYPKGFNSTIRTNQYRMGINAQRMFSQDSDKAIKELVQVTKARADFAIRCMSLVEDWDFMFTVFTCSDRIQHYALGLPKWKSLLYRIYSKIDKFLQYSFKEIDASKGVILLVSDHGFQSVEKIFLINSWLYQSGYLSAKIPRLRSKIRIFLREKDRLMSIYDKLLNSRLRPVLDGITTSLFRGLSGTKQELHELDLDHTFAFAGGSTSRVTRVWINDERFLRPSFKSSKKKILRELTEKLSNICDDKGKKVIKNIKLCIDNHKGTATERKRVLPDLIVTTNHGYTINPNTFDPINWLVAPPIYWQGGHDLNGLLGIYANPENNFKHIKQSRMPSVLDVAPTILNLYGLTIPSWMSGKALLDSRTHLLSEKRRLRSKTICARAKVKTKSVS